MESIFVASGRTLLLPDSLFTAPENWSFIGWKIGEKIYSSGEPVTVNTDITAVAQWSASLTITIEPGEGTGDPVSVPVSLDDKYPLPNYTDCNFTELQWHIFKGWAVNGDETDLKQPLESVTIESDTTVTAIWERPIRMVTFDLNGGSGEAPDLEVLNGEYASRPSVDPAMAGCDFRGWYANPDDEPFDFETPITGDITLIKEDRWWSGRTRGQKGADQDVVRRED